MSSIGTRVWCILLSKRISLKGLGPAKIETERAERSTTKGVRRAFTSAEESSANEPVTEGPDQLGHGAPAAAQVSQAAMNVGYGVDTGARPKPGSHPHFTSGSSR